MPKRYGASRRFSFLHIPRDAVGYELICLHPNIHIDQEGNIAPSSVAVYPFIREGRGRSPLPVNSDAGAVHYVFRTGESATPVPAVSVLSGTAVAAGGIRFDLVAKSDVTTVSSGGKTIYGYSPSSVLASASVAVIRDGVDGSGAAFTSIVFRRSPVQPATPEGGSYENPIPDTAGWSDAPESGSDPLWLSRARFTTDTTTPQWSAPSPVEDSTGIEYVFSASSTDPGAPADKHPYDSVSGGFWTKEADNAIWMAVAVKNNGIWSNWSYARIKGEAGTPGLPGQSAVSVSVSPETTVLKKGSHSLFNVYFDICEGEMPVAAEATGIPDMSGVPGVSWRGALSHDNRTYMQFFYSGKTDVDATIPVSVTYKGITYARTMSIKSVSDGADGKDGTNGVWVPPLMLWDDYPSGYMFQAGKPANGDTRLDMVGVLSAGGDIIPYYCTESHVKSARTRPGENDSRWQVADAGVYRFLATAMLLAANARIDFLSGQSIRIGSADGMNGYFGAPLSNGVIIYSGADNPDDATFKVYADGTVEATKAHISGNSTFRGFIYKEKTVITKDNYKDYIIRELIIDTPESGKIYQSTLDLVKTGNWIEIASLPENDDEFMGVLYPPVIRAGVAYTDEYRDYVRQFMGNELLIYNYSGRQIGVDNGSNTLSLNPEHGIHLRMTFAPENYNGNGYVECVKWEASPAYHI